MGPFFWKFALPFFQTFVMDLLGDSAFVDVLASQLFRANCKSLLPLSYSINNEIYHLLFIYLFIYPIKVLFRGCSDDLQYLIYAPGADIDVHREMEAWLDSSHLHSS
jgi:hypothetical protein